MKPTLTFHGAAGEVTGSCHLPATERSRVLLECGLHQGEPETERRNEAPFRFDPLAIDTLVLSHAHLDHSGLLPRLAAQGFDGPVHCTPATRDLLQVLLKDAAFLQERDVQPRLVTSAGPPPQHHLAGSLFATYTGSASCFLQTPRFPEMPLPCWRRPSVR
jgi:metallo-beta-lactamase family protein